MAPTRKQPPVYGGGKADKGGTDNAQTKYDQYGNPIVFLGPNRITNHQLYAPHVTEEFTHGKRYRDAHGKIREVKERYKTGADWALLAGMGTEELGQLQIGLVQAGLLKPGKFTPGALGDARTRSAVKELLGEANASGVRWTDYLSQRIQAAADSGFDPNAGSDRQPLTISLSNPDTIKAQVGADATNLLGSTAAAGDPNHYVDTIHAQETAQQTDAYNQAGGAGGTTTDPASVDALLIKEHPTEYKVNQLGQHGAQILNMLTQSNPGGMAG